MFAQGSENDDFDDVTTNILSQNEANCETFQYRLLIPNTTDRPDHAIVWKRNRVIIKSLTDESGTNEEYLHLKSGGKSHNIIAIFVTSQLANRQSANYNWDYWYITYSLPAQVGIIGTQVEVEVTLKFLLKYESR